MTPNFILMNSKIQAYSVKTLLGRGSFGEVYMVDKDGEIYACKKLTSFMNRETRKALHQEVKNILYNNIVKSITNYF